MLCDDVRSATDDGLCGLSNAGSWVHSSHAQLPYGPAADHTNGTGMMTGLLTPTSRRVEPLGGWGVLTPEIQFIMPPPPRVGALSNDVRLTSVCLSRTSA